MITISHEEVLKQRLPFNKKTKKWGQNIIDYYINTALIENESLRKHKLSINENYDIITGKLNESVLSKTFNPMGLEGEQVIVPTSNEVISIIKPALKTLIGEEYNRPFEYRVFVTNPDAISEKEKYIRNTIEERLIKLLQFDNLTDEALQSKLQEIQNWRQYSAQDIRERAANHLLAHYFEELNLRYVFNKGWKDVLAAAEEIYRIDINNGNPVVIKCNPLNIYTIRSADSTRIEDSDAIIEDSYMSPGAIVDEFYNDLTEKEISIIYGYTDEYLVTPNMSVVKSWEVDVDSLIEIDSSHNIPITNKSKLYKTPEGNIRVMRIYWKSLRKIGFLKYIDSVTGLQLEKIVDENYPVDKVAGDVVEWLWITEWWQGIRIGKDIYVRIQPSDVQRRDMNNISVCYPPFVGSVYNYNDREAQSLVDELKPIQYEWTVFSKKVSLLWSRNYGKLVKLDISKIPDDFDLDLFMTWIQSFGIIVQDPFKEGAKGQPSGQFQSALDSVDLELSTSINAALQYMFYLRELAEEITGITRQRKGDLMASDGLGVTQQGVIMSSKLTEELFQDHEYTKQRVMEALLETAKFTLKNNTNKKLQYLLDDLSFVMYNLDVESFTDASYGIKIADSTHILQQEMIYKSLAQSALQSGTLTFAQFMETTQMRSLSSKVAKMRVYEESQQRQRQEQMQQEQEFKMQMQQIVMEESQKNREHELMLKKMELDTKYQIEQLKIQSGVYNWNNKWQFDANKNGVQDHIEIQKQEMANTQRDEELDFKERKWEDEKRLKEQELEIKRKSINNNTK